MKNIYRHVLVIEDKPNLLSGWNRLIQKFKTSHIHLSESSHEALNIICKYPIDVLIMDLTQKKMESLHLINAIELTLPQLHDMKTQPYIIQKPYENFDQLKIFFMKMLCDLNETDKTFKELIF